MYHLQVFFLNKHILDDYNNRTVGIQNARCPAPFYKHNNNENIFAIYQSLSLNRIS